MRQFYRFSGGLLLMLVLAALSVQSTDLDMETSLDILSRLCQKNDYDVAYRMLGNFIPPSEVEKCPPKTQARYHFLKARCLLGLYELEQARACFAQALRLEPRNLEFLYWAMRCEPASDNYNACIALIEVALDVSKSDPVFLSYRALVQARVGNFVQAYADIATAERLSNNHKIKLNKALIFVEEKRWFEAESILVSLLQILEKEKTGFQNEWGYDYRADIYGGLARINLEFTLKYDVALNYINKAIQLEPQNGVWYLGRARIYSKLNEIDKAIADLDQVAEVSSGLKKVAEERKAAIQRSIRPIFRFDGFVL